MPDIPIWYYPIGLLVLTLSIIAVRLTAKFDINKWFQSKAERRENQIERLCTHTDVEWLSDERIQVNSRMMGTAIQGEAKDNGKC